MPPSQAGTGSLHDVMGRGRYILAAAVVGLVILLALAALARALRDRSSSIRS